VAEARQSCLSVDACLASPTRTSSNRTPVPNGCSVPPELAGVVGIWADVFREDCNQHDRDWQTFVSFPQFSAYMASTNASFLARMNATCASLGNNPTCLQAAQIFFLGVSTTQIAVDAFRTAQYNTSSCACTSGPGVPGTLSALVTNQSATLRWGAATGATSYLVEPIVPPVPPVEVQGTEITAPNLAPGSYTVQVRAKNATGVSPPSNAVTFAVTSPGVCAPPPVPQGVSGNVANNTATVQWNASAGATSYVVLAGSTVGLSDFFNGNVGNNTLVSAPVLPGFRAFIRIQAVSACGASGPSADVLIGGV
jgi:hypothetical protein